MATNTFKRFTSEDISNNSSSPTTIYTCATNVSSILIGFLVCNKLPNEIKFTSFIETTIVGSDNSYLVKDLLIPANTSTEIVYGKIVLAHDNVNGDVLKCYSDTASAIDVTLSILEDVNT